VPSDSYLIKYFDYMQKYLSVGPPVYIVLNNTGKDHFDLANETLRNRICGSGGCDNDSLQSQGRQFNNLPDRTYIYCDISKLDI
jgi:Niemann-Pick C1 protein